MHRPFAGNQGFSFMEVVIALAIFSIGIVGLYGIQTMTVTQNFTSSRVTTGSTWAAGKIEDLLTLQYDDVVDGNATSPDGVYTLAWTVATHSPLPNTKTISMVVTTVRTGVGSRVEMDYIKHDNM